MAVTGTKIVELQAVDPDVTDGSLRAVSTESPFYAILLLTNVLFLIFLLKFEDVNFTVCLFSALRVNNVRGLPCLCKICYPFHHVDSQVNLSPGHKVFG